MSWNVQTDHFFRQCRKLLSNDYQPSQPLILGEGLPIDGKNKHFLKGTKNVHNVLKLFVIWALAIWLSPPVTTSLLPGIKRTSSK